MRRRPRSYVDVNGELFDELGHNNPPAMHRETKRLYRAVLFLRIYGAVPVFRQGREHKVGNRRVSTEQLHKLAGAELSRRCGRHDYPDYVLYRLGMGPRPADYPAP